MLEPSRRRQVVEYLRGNYRVSKRRACRVSRMNRGTYRYRSHKDPQRELCMRIRRRAAVPQHATDLLVGHLNSLHVRDWLIADGLQIMLRSYCTTLRKTIMKQAI